MSTYFVRQSEIHLNKFNKRTDVTLLNATLLSVRQKYANQHANTRMLIECFRPVCVLREEIFKTRMLISRQG